MARAIDGALKDVAAAVEAVGQGEARPAPGERLGRQTTAGQTALDRLLAATIDDVRRLQAAVS